MSAFLSSHGGIVATALLILTCYNLVMSALAQIFNALKIQEPSFLQKAGQIGSTLVAWLSSNTPTVPPVVSSGSAQNTQGS